MQHRVLRSMETTEVSASSLVTPENSTEPITAPPAKKKLFAEDLAPEIRAQLKPTYPGSPLARHPITKQFVSLKPKPTAPAPSPTVVQPTVPTAEPVHETPPNTPLPTAQPEATAPADTTEPTPTEPESGPALDFSDLPKDGEPGAEKEPPRDPAQEANAHRTFVGFIWDGFVNLMVMIFGTEWFPQSAQERNAVIEAWVNALLWMGTRILNPLQLAYAATASYCFTRLFTFLRWWKNRREKRARVQPQEAQETEEPEQPGTNQQPHNFAGVNATED